MRRLSLLLATGVALASSAALACTTCTPNQGGPDQDAYIWMTVMMCLVPLGAVGGVVLWVRSEARKAAAQE
jgi:hypothetical protein